jgi:hypothetical protein
MFTMILLIYLQAGSTVNLVGATVSGEFGTQAMCQAEADRARGSLPIPRGYNAAWQDTLCVPIENQVRVGDERLTAFQKLLAATMVPDACKAEGACRRGGVTRPDEPGRPDKPDKPGRPGKHDNPDNPGKSEPQGQ